MITLKQLRYFVETFRTGNITQAAGRLNVAQTALGHQIRMIEEELGTALLVRHSRGVRATRAGEILAEQAVEILGRIDVLPSVVAQGVQTTKRRAVLGITPSIQNLIGTDLIMTARHMLKQLELQVIEELSFVLIDALQRREIDFALAYEIAAHPALSRIPLLEEQLLLIEAPHLDSAETITFAEAVASELAFNGRRDVVWRLVHSTAERMGLSVNTVFEVQSVEAIKKLVSKDVATSIMPYGVVEAELSNGKLNRRLIELPHVTRTLFLVRRTDNDFLEDGPEFETFVGEMSELLLSRIGPLGRRI